MINLAIGSVLLGKVFGRFFKVWVLIPACALTFAIVAARSPYYQYGLLSVLLEFTVIAASMQIGYAPGCLSGVVPDRLRRLEIPRKLSHPAVPRRRQLF